MEEKERFIELRAKGWSFDKIAKELGKAKQTLINWSKELEDEIANLKALELEALYEKHYLLKENRIETFGVLLRKLKDEVMSRDLSDVPTDKLLDLLLKYENQLKDEIITPIYKTSEEIKEAELDKELLNELTNMKPERRLKVG
jgi:hypothetical protein